MLITVGGHVGVYLFVDLLMVARGRDTELGEVATGLLGALMGVCVLDT